MIHLMIVHLFGLMTPGPDFFYISRMAAGNSRRNTLCAIIGITFGVTFWATVAMLGLAIVLKTTPMLQGAVMVAGGSYLMYLGFLMLKSRSNAVFESVSDEELNSSTTIPKEIFKGLLVNLSNAKAIIYFDFNISLWQLLFFILIYNFRKISWFKNKTFISILNTAKT